MAQLHLITFLCIALAALSCTVYGSLQITAKEHTLMKYTKLRSEEHFTAGLRYGLSCPVLKKSQIMNKWDV
jgi:hypothetical protein